MIHSSESWFHDISVVICIYVVWTQYIFWRFMMCCTSELSEFRSIFLSTSNIYPPANKVWGKVIFSQVCVSHYVHRGVFVWCHFLFGCLVHVPSGGLSLVPCSLSGVSLTETPLERDPHDTVKIGQYASYWNAFLFTVVTILLLHQQCSHKWHRFSRLIHIQAVHL